MPNNVIPMPSNCPPQDQCTVPPWGPFPPPYFPPVQPPWYPGANAGVSFSVTPPPNPIRGHFWWNGQILSMWDGVAWVVVSESGQQGLAIVSATAPPNPVTGMMWWDGAQMRVFDGLAWEVVGPGAAAGPTPTTVEVFRILQPTAVPIDPAVWTIIPFTTTPVIDTKQGWNSATKQYMPKTRGFYSFKVAVVGQEPAPGSFGFLLTRNDPGSIGINTEITIANTEGVGAAASGYLTGSAIQEMNGSTDYVRLWYFSTAGTDFGLANQAVITAHLLP